MDTWKPELQNRDTSRFREEKRLQLDHFQLVRHETANLHCGNGEVSRCASWSQQALLQS